MRSVLGTQLVDDVVHMKADGAEADPHLDSDLTIPESVSNQAQARGFSRGQRTRFRPILRLRWTQFRWLLRYWHHTYDLSCSAYAAKKAGSAKVV